MVAVRAHAAVLRELRAAFAAAADSARAAQMQAYMKSVMPFHGVPMAETRRIAKQTLAGVPLADADEWRALMLHLWHHATHREERYAARDLAADRRARCWQTMETLPAYEDMIVSGAWWDLVDPLAGHRLGEILRAEPAPTRKAMLRWARHDDMWLRRSAILCQLHLKHDTDLEFLHCCMEPSFDSTEFFLRKAIGWALRQYAWTNADAVRAYVDTHRARLSPLSLREAMKNLPPA